MQALKLQGEIDESGHLIIFEPITLTPGEVEIIILQSPATREKTTLPTSEAEEIQSETSSRTKIEAFKDLFAKTTPTSADFDYDRAKWEYLKEKHDL